MTSSASCSEQLGLNEHHQTHLASYLKFARQQRQMHLRTVDAAFEDAIASSIIMADNVERLQALLTQQSDLSASSRLTDLTYTRDEVEDLLRGVGSEVHDEVSSELLNADHTASLLLRQLFLQAQRWHLRLDAQLDHLENRELIEMVRQFDQGELNGLVSSNVTLTSINSSDPTLTELHKLAEENSTLQQQIELAQSQAASLAQKKEELGAELDKLRHEIDSMKTSHDSQTKQQLSQLQVEREQVRRDLTADLQQSEFSRTQLADELVATTDQLQQVQTHLQLAEKELERKFQQTGAYRNMKKIISEKNVKIRGLRSRLQQHEPDEDDDEDVEGDV